MRAALINTDSFTVQLTRDMPDTKALDWLQSKIAPVASEGGES